MPTTPRSSPTERPSRDRRRRGAPTPRRAALLRLPLDPLLTLAVIGLGVVLARDARRGHARS